MSKLQELILYIAPAGARTLGVRAGRDRAMNRPRRFSGRRSRERQGASMSNKPFAK